MTLGTSSFRGVSRDSVTELRDRLAESTPTNIDELFAVAELLDEQPTLRRALTDPSRTAEDRAGLAASLLDGRVSAEVTQLVTEAARRGWSRVRDMADALEYLGVFAQILAAQRAGILDDLEDELFRFGRIVENTRELRAALGDSTVPAERRAELARDLIGERASEGTVRLVRQAVSRPRGRDLLSALESYVLIASAWRERLVAVVRTAVPLDEAHQQRLKELLSRQYDRDVDLNLIVDETVVGGLRIEVGDDVIDGSVAARLDQARRKLAS